VVGVGTDALPPLTGASGQPGARPDFKIAPVAAHLPFRPDFCNKIGPRQEATAAAPATAAIRASPDVPVAKLDGAGLTD